MRDTSYQLWSSLHMEHTSLCRDCTAKYVENSEVMNVDFKIIVKKSRQDQFVQSWYGNIKVSEKDLLYRKFKMPFRFEKYLGTYSLPTKC